MRFLRNSLPKGIRHEVLKRDNYRCVECGASNFEIRLEVDHIKSVAKGGTDEMDNLQTLCEVCNGEKNDLIFTRTENEKRQIEINKNIIRYIEKHKDDKYLKSNICYYCERDISEHNRDNSNVCLFMLCSIMRQKVKLFVDDMDESRHPKHITDETKLQWSGK